MAFQSWGGAKSSTRGCRIRVLGRGGGAVGKEEGGHHEHGDDDKKPRKVGRHDVEEAKDGHLRVGVLARPDPDRHKEEGDGEEGHVEARDCVDDHDSAPP